MILLVIGTINPVEEVMNILSSVTKDIRLEKTSNIGKLICHKFITKQTLSSVDVLSIRRKLANLQIDLLAVENLLDSRMESLFVFDMDSTLIEQEVIDELARANQVYDKVAEITERAMQGELDFDAALRERCKLLAGVTEDIFEIVYNKITPSQGVDFFLKNIKTYPSRLAVFSGGFVPIVQRFANQYNFDEYRANVLEIEEGKLTGKVIGEIVNRQKKKEYLLAVQDKFQIPTSQVVAIGDGSNDTDMLLTAGVGVGFHPKEGLKKNISNWIEFSGMEAVLFLLS